MTPSIKFTACLLVFCKFTNNSESVKYGKKPDINFKQQLTHIQLNSYKILTNYKAYVLQCTYS